MGHTPRRRRDSGHVWPPRDEARPGAVPRLAVAAEAVAWSLIALSPWALGASEPVFEFILDAGVAVLLLIWACRAAVEGRWTVAKCPVGLCLAGLVLLGVWQMTPLPHGWLARLSPATAAVYERFLPAQPEVVDGAPGPAPVSPPPGSTLSLYPGVTRREVVRLLAAFLFFLAVRTNVASAASLRRLSAVVVVNGAALSLFGIAQHLATRDWGSIYGSVPVQGLAFGPFVYRNYFAGYINLCIGLGLGLALSRREAAPEPQGLHGRRRRVGEAVTDGQEPTFFDTLAKDWWIYGSLALMLTSLFVCQSRGGVLIPLITACVLAVPLRTNLRREHFLFGVGVCAVIASLLVWLGFSWSESRLRTVTDGRILEDGRFAIWARVLPLVRDFPVWGTGYGTFPYLDQPLQTREKYHVVDYAHNEYLEGWVEGGLLRLLLTVCMVVYLFRRGWRGATAAADRRERCLALGALFAFTALALHDTVDFITHLPSVVVLAVAVAAQLSAIGNGRRPGTEGDDAAAEGRRPGSDLRLGGFAPWVGCAAAVLCALVLVGEGWANYRAQKWLLRTLDLDGGDRHVSNGEKIAALQAAAAAQPRSARLYVLLGQAYESTYREQRARDEHGQEISNAVQAVTLPLTGFSALGSVRPSAVCGLASSGNLAVEVGRRQAARDRSARTCLVPALTSYLRARDLCPLIAKPHVRIAALHGLLKRADGRDQYLDRATRLVSYDAELWYLRGNQAQAESRRDAAFRCWRRSLELSDRHLTVILRRGQKLAGDFEIAHEILPDQPRLLLEAARVLYPDEKATAGRRVYGERALALLEAQESPPTAEDLHAKAEAAAGCGRAEEAIAAYRAALRKDFGRIAWRYEYALLLHAEGQSKEAAEQVQIILSQQPKHDAAQRLWKEILRDAVRPAAPVSPRASRRSDG